MKAPRVLVLASAAALALGCSNQVVTGTGGSGPGTTTTTTSSGSNGTGGGTSCTGAACTCGAGAEVERLALNAVNKIDLVLVVDNSASMADKQAILALALPDLVNGLVNPACVDDTTLLPVSAALQPATPLEACPAGSMREFSPVLDMHIGMLSSSLGTFGANGCPETAPSACNGPTSSISNDDHGHLVTRTSPCADTNVPTYQSEGFLAWDPAQMDNPPGEDALGDPASMTPGLLTSLTNLVAGDGEEGCGFESQNESWYRFLVDPTPYASISLDSNNLVVTTGIDNVLLQQRKEFLRPDSLLAVVEVTDETDTSLKEFSSYPLFAEPALHLPHATAACTTKGPNDPCCASCGQATPAGCAADPACTSDPYYTAADENTSLRAFGLISHKERYGIEFFYQPSRYVGALTSPTIANNNNEMVPNPIYSILDPANDSATVRDPSLVFYAAIVGVPWQLIARQTAAGVPDLVNGVSALDPSQVGGFKSAAELELLDKQGHTFWDDIAGNPSSYVPAYSPFMVESTVPRSGTDPITGAAIAPPSTPNGGGPMVGGSLLNDHEWNIPAPAGDIEYACVFPILNPLDCSDPSVVSCDCRGLSATADNPLCEANPNDSGNLTLQTKAKAYPGIKHLAIARGMGNQGIAASICAKQLTDNTAADYGYRPAINAIIDRLKGALGGGCLAQPLTADAAGQVACSILEARTVPAGTCSCGAGRIAVPAADQCFQQAVTEDPLDATDQWNCFCEIPQTAGAALASCQSDVTPTSDGWCYVAAGTGSNPALLQGCGSTPQTLRFVGTGEPAAGSTVFLACQ